MTSELIRGALRRGILAALCCFVLSSTARAQPGNQPADVADADATADDQPAVEGAEPDAGWAAVQQAHAGAKTARTLEDVSAIVAQCEEGLTAGLSEEHVAYANKLLAWAYNRRGEFHSAAGQEVDALGDFESSVALDPTRWKSLYNRAVSYANSGRLEEAEADLTKCIQLKPEFVRAHFNRGEVRFAAGRTEDAIQDYNRALQLSPRLAEALNSRGFAQYTLGDYRAALRDYDQAIRFDERNAEAHVNRGDALSDQGDYARAARDYQQALRLAPDNSRACVSWAWLLATSPVERYRDPEAALQYAQRAIELEQQPHYRYLDVLAAAHAAAEQFEQAQEVQAQAVALAPDDEKDIYQQRLDLYAAGRPYRSGRGR